MEALEPRLLLSDLPAPAGGALAIERLGDRLPSVAERYGLTPEDLRTRLSNDPGLLADSDGWLLYADPVPEAVDLPAAAEDAGAPAAPLAAPFPYDQTFLLHSRPGATKVIYLDFDGHEMPRDSTAWTHRSLSLSAFTLDGDPATFTQVEQDRIQGIWQRVAERYSAFDVDVTTAEPTPEALTRSNTSDQAYGMRVVITPDNEWYGHYGGVAYVGVFSEVGDYYKPCFVFSDQLANNEKYIAEAIAHEAGHTLGLLHDGLSTGVEYYNGHGSGTTGWAPIMGTAYYSNVAQWSKGEYYHASQTQDDLSIIVSQNGFGYRPDDFGQTMATASPLTIVGGSLIGVQGVIEQNTDVDMFSFTVPAGSLQLGIAPFSASPGLDVLARLYDSAGNLITLSGPTDLLSASFSLSMTAGTYYVSIDGTGWGTPLANPPSGYTDYGSIGQYWITGAFTASQPASVIGRQIFFNNSALDGSDPAANADDDMAIAADKQPLLGGAAATVANFTNYALGINGIMIDIDGLAGAPAAGDFVFTVGNTGDPDLWLPAPAPLGITVRLGAGAGGSDRVTIIWADNAIHDGWLRVEVLPAASTGLAAADVFYWGNLRGDTNYDGSVNLFDLLKVRQNYLKPLGDPTRDDAADVNYDGSVDLFDLMGVRLSYLSQLTFFSAPQQTETEPVQSASLSDEMVDDSADGWSQSTSSPVATATATATVLAVTPPAERLDGRSDDTRIPPMIRTIHRPTRRPVELEDLLLSARPFLESNARSQ